MSGYSDIEKTRSVSGLTEQAKHAVHPYLQIIPARKNLAVRIRNIIIADLRLKVNIDFIPGSLNMQPQAHIIRAADIIAKLYLPFRRERISLKNVQ